MAVIKEAKKLSLSYFSKEKIICPVCKKTFSREIMRSGNGRMIAGKLTDELHRNFEPSARYGRVFPMIYEIGACPNCYSAMYWNDFKEKIPREELENLYSKSKERKEKAETIFPYFNLKHERTLYDGAAMYYLALLTYDNLGSYITPTLKKGIISLRLAWLTHDMDMLCSDHNFDIISKIFYSKALFFYQQSLYCETDKSEASSSLANMGPDIDKNYGWDGVVYLCGLLEYKYGQQNDMQLRLKKLSESKTAIARIFGLGKSSKNKPGPLLEHARDLYDRISKLVADDEF